MSGSIDLDLEGVHGNVNNFFLEGARLLHRSPRFRTNNGVMAATEDEEADRVVHGVFPLTMGTYIEREDRCE